MTDSHIFLLIIIVILVIAVIYYLSKNNQQPVPNSGKLDTNVIKNQIQTARN